MNGVSACIGASPHLLSRVPESIPKMLLRGVVDRDVLDAGSRPLATRKPWVVYSGTHYRGKGLKELIAAWNTMNVNDWELHIAGRGELTSRLEQMARDNRTIVFHGLLDRAANARLLGAARIGINPHDVSATPGNVFAFKIIEYLAAGAHCISTPMGALEREIEAGITYMPDNTPQTIASTLQCVISERRYEQLATQATQDAYGPDAVTRNLDRLVTQVTSTRAIA
jgi:glycosyltransferase involved in cell wall biosynthesis